MRGRKKKVIWGKVKYGKGSLRIVAVYINGDLESKLEKLREWLEGREDGIRTIIGGDFKARTGEDGGRISIDGEEEEEARRRSKDKRIKRGQEINCICENE